MNYYPISTVVTLKGGNRPLMIYGRKQLQTSSNMVWDYVACCYPEGSIGEDYNIFFQQEEIGQILYFGYESELDRKMQQILQEKNETSFAGVFKFGCSDFIKNPQNHCFYEKMILSMIRFPLIGQAKQIIDTGFIKFRQGNKR